MEIATSPFVIDGAIGSVCSALGSKTITEMVLSHSSFSATRFPRSRNASLKELVRWWRKASGKYSRINAQLQQTDLPDATRRRLTGVASRALHIQWVTGNAEKAEASFFKINTEGTPLDDIEELLLRNRQRPIAISARAVIRAGKGHRYWSAFPPETAAKIEDGVRPTSDFVRAGSQAPGQNARFATWRVKRCANRPSGPDRFHAHRQSRSARQAG